MVRLQVLVYFVLSLLTCISAARITRPKTSFKVAAKLNPKYEPNGIVAYRRTLAKYGVKKIKVPKGAKVTSRVRLQKLNRAHLQARANGRVSAVPTEYEAQYLSTISVGNQKLTVQFDTGSSDTWVFNERLPAASRQNHTIFDSTKSNSFSLLSGYTFNISYGDGSSTSGPVGTDLVNIGGIFIAGQAIGVPNVVSEAFEEDLSLSGLVGLAFTRLNSIRPVPQNSLFDNILPILSEPVLAVSLPDGDTGLFEFGKIDHNMFSGDLNRVPVNPTAGYWEFSSPSAKVNNNNITNARPRALADTGSSIMLCFDSLVTAYYAQVSGAYFETQVNGYIFPCTATLPALSLALGSSYVAVIAGELINYAEVGQDGQGNKFCYGGIQSNQGLPFAIYGDVFFKSQFTVFEGSGPSLGFAPLIT